MLALRWRAVPRALKLRWRVADAQAAASVTPPAPAPASIVIGPRGRTGPPGGGTFEFVQISAAAEWVINHNLGRNPAVTLLSPGGVEVEASVTHASINQTIVQFNTPYAGKAVMR